MSPWGPNPWYTVRITMDDAGDSLSESSGVNGRAKMYLDGTLIAETDNSFIGQDDPALLMGASDHSSMVDTEWDDLRVKVGR